MKVSTLKKLDEGISMLEKYGLEKIGGADSAYDRLEIDVFDLRELRKSLKSPATIDIEKWAKFIRVLQYKSSQLGETKKINERALLASLEQYKDGMTGVVFQNNAKSGYQFRLSKYDSL